MFLAPRIRLSLQFEEFPENQLFPLEGIHDDEFELIEGNQEFDDEGHQLLDPDGIALLNDEDHEFDDDIIEEPSTTPTPSPMPNTARTVESG